MAPILAVLHKASNPRALSSHLLQNTSLKAKYALRRSHPIKLSTSVILTVVAREVSDQALKAQGAFGPKTCHRQLILGSMLFW